MGFWHSTSRKRKDRSTVDKKYIEDLVERAKQGDACAFGKLYDLFVKGIYRFVYTRIRSRDDAEDITAETWKIVWMNLKKYRRGNFQGYIFRIAYTSLIGHVRKHKKTESLGDYGSIPAKGLAPEKKLERKEEVAKLYQALKKLPKNYAEIVVLRFIEGFSIKEVSVILNKSQVSVRVTQYRAMKKLQKLMHT